MVGVACVAIVLALEGAAARADAVTDKMPYLQPAAGTMDAFLGSLAGCAPSVTLPMAADGSSVHDVPVYTTKDNLSDYPNAPTGNAFGGAILSQTGGLPAPYIALNTSLMSADGFPICMLNWAVIHHELHHVRWSLWIHGVCAGEPDPAACQKCHELADQCMKNNDPEESDTETADGKDNHFEESRAKFATALCLCKKACALTDGDPEKLVLEALAGSYFGQAQDHWGKGEMAWANCPDTAMQNANCSFPDGYPMAPLNAGGQPEVPYDGPFNDPQADPPKHPDQAGLNADGSCDCDYEPPGLPPETEWDPCDEGNLEDSEDGGDGDGGNGDGN